MARRGDDRDASSSPSAIVWPSFERAVDALDALGQDEVGRSAELRSGSDSFQYFATPSGVSHSADAFAARTGHLVHRGSHCDRRDGVAVVVGQQHLVDGGDALEP